MKQRFLSLLLACVMALSLAAPASAAKGLPFSDVKASDWFYDEVKDLYNWEVINGMTASTFEPQGTVTFGQALKMILLSAGYREQAPTDTHWASGYYQLAAQKGFLPKKMNLDLDDPINRKQIAQITVKVLGVSRTGAELPFTDTGSKDALILYDHGIFTGEKDANGNLLFKPNSNITRAEISAVIWRLYNLDLPEKEPEPTPTGDYFTFGGKKVYIVEELPENTYDREFFQVNEQGLLTYNSDEYTCKVGIDVSRYQGTIDWAQVKEAGVDFAILRLGYRGYGTGKMVLDNYFYQNLKGALANDIEVGVYFFSQAISPAEAQEEARFCMNALKGYEITYPIVFDWEPYDSSLEPRTDELDDKVLTQCAVAFCEEVKAGGYQPMVYANPTYFYFHFDLNELINYPFWLAHYNTFTNFYYHFDIWQYSDGKYMVGPDGTFVRNEETDEPIIPGIDGYVDLNIHFIPKK
ncbi:MAG: S-layer homology domain-containing protein [Ruminiclostridium sp.]|nr:S-layer homology domain-containing protein [Ruminiclostridium sp.]